MSQSPAAVVQAAYVAFGSGDIATLLALCSEDTQWSHNGPASLPYGVGVHRGKSAVAEWFGHVAAHDDIRQFEPREFFAGPDHCTVLGWERTADRTTGREFACAWTHFFEVRDGKITRFVGAFDSDQRHRAAQEQAA